MNADEIRSCLPAMRDAVRRVALERRDVWAGPFPQLTTALAELGRVDLCLARLLEGHADAVRILDQAGLRPRDGVYGVWASRSAGTGVRAVPDGQGWRLTGQSRFSSGVDVIDRALVPGWVDEEKHLLFDLDATQVEPDRSSWHTSAMDASRSFTVHVDVPAREEDVVGPPGFYLERRGFPIGGLEVAAVWVGGAQSVLEQVVAGLRAFHATVHQTRRVGVMEQAVWQAGVVLEATAARLSTLDGDALVRETAAARTAVVTACEQVVEEAARVVGPAGLSGNGALARTLADLALYIRQHHVDLAAEALGRDALRDRQVTG